jgi:lytic murein transglycosylase
MTPLRAVCLAVPLALTLALVPSDQNRASAQLAIGADEQTASFQGYLQYVAAKARGEGISQRAIDSIIAGLSYNPRVVALDRAQPGSSGAPTAFMPYYTRHIGQSRINQGRGVLAANADLAARIEAEYGVPRQMIIAIWGKETFYGAIRGDFDLARSLATLAYDGRRRALFEGELIALMKMADRGVPRSRMLGSWAGAFGNPQFLPSVYLRNARDGDGDGVADIWTNRADTFASIAHYFADAGWRKGEPWGVRAAVPAGFDATPVATRLGAPSCPRVFARHSAWKTVAEWRELGITPRGAIADQTMATLIEPDGRGNTAYLLTGNYRVILQYNCSNYYALSVGLLADEIAR